MRVQIVWQGIKRDSVREKLVTEKLAPLDKLLADFEENMKEATVRIEEGERWGVRVSFSMRLGKRKIFAQEHEEDLMKVVVAVREEAERQIKRVRAEMSWKSGGK